MFSLALTGCRHRDVTLGERALPGCHGDAARLQLPGSEGSQAIVTTTKQHTHRHIPSHIHTHAIYDYLKEFLMKLSSLWFVQVALWTFGQLVENTG